ncbi:FAR1 DNA binding domain, Zinc finger, SWIM-type, MULE transposase domain, FHY3/FAR1 family [Artemisia annua]|uniref:FAR1 DNA binding domain, Zinc finger, SWIM-type, MULE transposase domain, FHY3/FAR1 family n=1 Tax=Artemisia annua TaxID=35608 RepID=A0A2U1PNK4_ARTAN|nr:FAR1 DNA binding domain, Zinc finger, SWIM-type, MULE transposase domain, FHY3/FAR1 family [Artemisia annua]
MLNEFKFLKNVLRYNMVFVSFTAIDNDGKSVAIVAGMLKSEYAESYIWLLESFLTTFYKQPTLVVTYQDAMKRM